LTEPHFDPYAILGALERHRAAYVLIGGLARVLHGADEVTGHVDVCISGREADLRRLAGALAELEARREGGAPLDLEAAGARENVIELETPHGPLKLVFEPEGTRGWNDLRRHASREAIGQGIRASVADAADLARMLAARDRSEDIERLRVMQRLAELDRSLGLSL
jgi:hypothetical protein